MEKELKVIKAPNIDRLISGANELGIKKEDIVNIITIPNGYVLIYFG